MRYLRIARDFQQNLTKEPGTREALVRVAQRAARRARDLTPDGSGRTARSYVVEDDEQGVSVGNTDPFFHLTEFGSVNNPPYAPLRRAIRAEGLRIIEPGQ